VKEGYSDAFLRRLSTHNAMNTITGMPIIKMYGRLSMRMPVGETLASS
jgi:hypothetical protein